LTTHQNNRQSHVHVTHRKNNDFISDSGACHRKQAFINLERPDARAQCRTRAACTACVRKSAAAAYVAGHGMCVSNRSRVPVCGSRKMSYSVC
jgi:hypothetical protein